MNKVMKCTTPGDLKKVSRFITTVMSAFNVPHVNNPENDVVIPLIGVMSRREVEDL